MPREREGFEIVGVVDLGIFFCGGKWLLKESVGDQVRK